MEVLPWVPLLQGWAFQVVVLNVVDICGLWMLSASLIFANSSSTTATANHTDTMGVMVRGFWAILGLLLQVKSSLDLNFFIQSSGLICQPSRCGQSLKMLGSPSMSKTFSEAF